MAGFCRIAQRARGLGTVKCGEVYWVNLAPIFGSEIRKTRPCLVVSPNDVNANTPRVIVAPLTSKGTDADLW